MRIAIRVDASADIGTGHVRRCLSLAAALTARGASVHFLCRGLPGHLGTEISAAGHELRLLRAPTGPIPADPQGPAHTAWLGVGWIQDAEETIEALVALEPVDWLVVDHYALERRWQSMVRPAVGQILMIDDLADRVHECDVLVDPSAVGVGPERYDGLVPEAAKRLIGPRYAPLRPEFSALRARRQPADGVVRRLLVFFGGADRTPECLKLLQAVEQLGWQDLAVDMLLPIANPYREEVVALVDRLPGVTLMARSDSMGALMTAADFAIGAAGTTSWERCCVGLPAALVGVADNQRVILDTLPTTGAALSLGMSETTTMADYAALLRLLRGNSGWVKRMADAARAVTDGGGAARLARIMMPAQVTVRPATADDCDTVHRWRNHPAVRETSFDRSEIPIEHHRQWYQAALETPSRVMLIGEHEGHGIGFVRFDLDGAVARISIFLNPRFMGQGLGPILLRASEVYVAKGYPAITRLQAEVVAGNPASSHLFKQGGYQASFEVFYKPLLI